MKTPLLLVKLSLDFFFGMGNYCRDPFSTLPPSRSTSRQILNEPFTASPNHEDIDTTFSVIDGLLIWSNPAFDGGVATFCTPQSGALRVVCAGPLPQGCSATNIRVVARSASLSSSHQWELHYFRDFTPFPVSISAYFDLYIAVINHYHGSFDRPSASEKTSFAGEVILSALYTFAPDVLSATCSLNAEPAAPLPPTTATYSSTSSQTSYVTTPADSIYVTSIVPSNTTTSFGNSTTTVMFSPSSQDPPSSATPNSHAPYMPASSAFGFWDDTVVSQGRPQGVFYEIDGNRVTFEYYLSHFARRGQILPTSSSHLGVSATVGIQYVDGNGNALSLPPPFPSNAAPSRPFSFQRVLSLPMHGMQELSGRCSSSHEQAVVTPELTITFDTPFAYLFRRFFLDLLRERRVDLMS
ncbi:MAG: hypothetical protein Q9173_005636 [Seirophora scorigena]